MKIRTKTLELIAKKMGEMATGMELVSFLEGCGVSPKLIIYPNTKWRMVFDVLYALSSSQDKLDQKILSEIITRFVHPLTFSGDEDVSNEIIKLFNRWLKYDDLEIIAYDKKIGLQPILKDEDAKIIEEQINNAHKDAIKLIKSKHLDNLILLKKGYQILINVVETFFEERLKPSEQLNEAYIKIFKILDETLTEILLDPKIKDACPPDWILPEPLYRPFKNLYGAKAEIKDPLFPLEQDIIPRMNTILGDIIDLCIECGAGDILSESQTQKLFNKTALYLTKLKEKRRKETEKTPPEEDVKRGKPQKLKIKFDEKESKINANGKQIKIPYAKNQYYLCKALFSKPKKRWENDELLEEFGIDIEGSKIKRQAYDAMIAINEKVEKAIDIRDLILYENKTFRLNPKYL